jgi:hypothetical protein
MGKDKYSNDHIIEVAGGTNTLLVGVSPVSGTTNLVISGDLSVNGEVSGSLDIEGNVIIGGSLSVIGASTFNNDVSVGGDDTLYVSQISAGNSVPLNISGNNQNLSVTTSIDKVITIGSANENVELKVNNITPKFTFNGSKSTSTGIVQIFNNSNNDIADGLDITLGITQPTSTNAWIRFIDGAGTRRGRIRGTTGDPQERIVAPGDDNETVSDGDVVFASGSADYAEWVSAGDLNEWSDISLNFNSGWLGLQEGYVVYVRNKAFYKEAPGTPMVVTHRAIVVGNEREGNSLGEILSFIGQVPVIVDGRVESGDFLIPTGGNFCIAKHPGYITFQDYIRAVGVAWQSKEDDERGKVLCAIGVRSIYME